jgi:IMP dehydrogenase
MKFLNNYHSSDQFAALETFDDVLLVPQYSDIQSRSEVDISTELGKGVKLKLPIISANMDTITDFTMAKTMNENGGLGVLHRYISKEQTLDWLRRLDDDNSLPLKYHFPSIGNKPEDREAALEYREFTDCICVDVAHGHSKETIATVKHLKNAGYANIIAGNVATSDGAYALFEAGANIIKIGIGPGSVCTTRIVTGHGVPQLSAINNVYKFKQQNYLKDMSIIADGGIKNSGDIVKALAFGADAVMIGGLFAGYQETPSCDLGVYRGMASKPAQVDFKGKVSNNTAEGVSCYVAPKGSVVPFLEELAGGIRSGFSYSGARNLEQFRKKAVVCKVTSNVIIENRPHFY